MTQRHGETERRLEGFEARIEQGFAWLEAHAREVITVVLILFAVGGLAAFSYEWYGSSVREAQLAIDRVTWTYMEEMGGSRGDLYPVEPANQDQAQRAREEALAGYEAASEEYGGLAREMAQLRAAEVEIGLARLEAAEARLAREADQMSNQVLRASALRLRGYALEELGRPAEAAEVYEIGGGIEGYPAREDLWLLSAETRLRTGDFVGAAAAYREILFIAPEFAERQGLVERLEELEALAPPGTPPSE